MLEDEEAEFTCDICGNSYSSEKGLSIHTTKTHEQGPSREDLLDELHDASEHFEGTPGRDEFADLDGYTSPSVFQRRFGSWNDALDEAGLEPNQQRASKEELIAEAERLAEELGRKPKLSDLNDRGKYGTGTVYRFFDSWNDVLSAIGFAPNQRRNIPDEELLNALRSFAEDLGRPPTQAEMRDEGEFAVNTYQERFGSWSAAKEKAGLSGERIQPALSVSEDELLEALEDECERRGRAPTRVEMNEDGPYHSSTYSKKTGSWGEALAKVGYKPVHEVGLSESDLIEELARLGEVLGRPPRVKDIQEKGKYSETPYAARFEDWNAALREAGYDPSHYRDAIEIECSTCGETLERAPSTVGEHSFCDQDCKGEFWSERFSGEGSPRWKGGYDPYYGENWLRQRRKARERDDYQCVSCGMTDKEHVEEHGCELHVHHITPIREYDDPEEANDLSNLITLCHEHHNKWEGTYLQPDVRDD